MNSRDIVLKILLDVEKGQSLSDCLNRVLNYKKVENVNIITELSYGIFRYIFVLDYYLQKFTKYPLNKLPRVIHNILRIGVYQILYLDKIPISVSVNESVELAKIYGHKGTVKLVNALLRKIATNKESLISENITVRFSLPDWIVNIWNNYLGKDNTFKLSKFILKQPDLNLRINTLKISINEFTKLLQDNKISFEPGVLKESIILKQNIKIQDIPGYYKGYFFVQNIGSILVSHILNPQPGEIIYDFCSGSGGKSTHMAQLMNNIGRIISIDINKRRLKLLEENCKRLGSSIVEPICKNIQEFFTSELADRILLDAPCSGLGVISHKPDIKIHRTPDSIKKIVKLQKELLEHTSKFLKPGGRIVYTTCTINPLENENVVEEFLKHHPEFVRIDLNSYLPECWRIDKPQYKIQLLPHIHKSDGFFIVLLQKLSK